MNDQRLIWDALVDAYYEAVPLATFNVLWFILTLPVITALPATAGLYYATNQLAHQKHVTWRTFFEGFRSHFWLGWHWGLANLLVLMVLGFNFWFYGRVEASWAVWAQGALLGLMGLWGFLQLYTFPLLLEQEDRRMRIALRNSLVLFLKHPAFSIGLAFFVMLLVLVSTFLLPPFWLLFTASLSAYLANRGTIDVIKRSQSGPHKQA